MTTRLILFFFLFATYNLNAQIHFEKGYIIKKDGSKRECLIKNVDWANTPSKVIYKLSAKGSTKVASPEDIQEFGIPNKVKFKSFTVYIDKSNQEALRLRYSSQPEYKRETLFLSTIVEGTATLYSFIQGNAKVYFYNLEANEVKQLFFKKYKNKEEFIRGNYQYRQQLIEHMTCGDLNIEVIKNLPYEKSALINYFIQYNTCVNSDFKQYEIKPKQDLINLSIRPGLYSSRLLLENRENGIDFLNFGNLTGFRLGLELEFLLPFNKNKWGVFIEPNYREYETEGDRDDLTLSVNYRSIELPIGLRHYFFLNDKSKIFANFLYIIDLDMGSSIKFEDGGNFTIASLENLGFGLGFKYNDRLGFEIRYSFDRELIPRAIPLKSDYDALSLILGYTIF